MIKRILSAGTAVFLLAGAAANPAYAQAANHEVLVLSASNTTTNALMVFDSAGVLVKQVPTQGQGGASGNAGGIAVGADRVAVVNFGSSNVSIFAHDGGGRFRLERVVPTTGSPVSVAFGANHLYVLTTTHVESHQIGPWGVTPTADGVAQLVLADGSAAQVGFIKGQLILTEKNNAIESVHLSTDGAVTGATALVAGIPANVNAPFGLATRGDEAYVTIAHANEISLVRNDTVLTVTGSGTQNAPCWVALDGPFLFSSNSPSQTVSRYAVYGQKLVQDAAVIARFTGNPTDIAYHAGFAAVVDANATSSRVSVFKVDEDGNFTLQGKAAIASPATNGVAVVDAFDWQ